MSRKIHYSLSPFLFVFCCIYWGLGQAVYQDVKKEPLSKWSKQWLEEVVPYIITKDERSVFLSLPNEAERGKFIQSFWQKRDPNPGTPENEFKIAYYKRIAITNKLFGIGERAGWRTDRGKIFILLGPPQEIQRDFAPSGSGFDVYHGTREIWNYWGLRNPRLPYNLEFVFIDKFDSGNYVLEESLSLGQKGRQAFDIASGHYYFDRLEILAEAMKNPFENQKRLEGIVTTKVSYNLIPIKSNIFRLKGTPSSTYIPLIVEIPYGNLEPKMIEDKYYYSMNFMVRVSDQQGRMILQKTKDINIDFSPPELPSLAASLYRFQTALFLPPGDYGFSLLILDNFSGKIGAFNKNLFVRDFAQEQLSLSDVILSPEAFSKKRIVLKERGEDLSQFQIFIDAKDTFRSGGELNIYFEIYNLALDPARGRNRFRVEYMILRNERVLTRIPHTGIHPTIQRDCEVQTSIRIKNFEPGEYVLQIKVMDENSGKAVEEQTLFRIID